MEPRFSLLLKFLLPAIVFCHFGVVANGQAALVTDSLDYHPGSIVNINGSGFAGGETVVLQVTHVTGGNNETSSAHAPWNVVADESGNITASWLVPTDQDELGASLILTADGRVSSLHTERFFTDGIITVTTANVLWSSLLITSSDAVVVKAGGSLVVDVADGVCASIRLAGGSSDGATGSQGNGTLIFNAGTRLTVIGIVMFGASDGSSLTGTLDMTKGGKLVCNGFAKNGAATQKLIPGIGTIELNATNTLLPDFLSYNNLTIALGTTSLKVAVKAKGLLTVTEGAVLDLSGLNFTVGSLSGAGAIANMTSAGAGKNILSTGTDSTSTTFSGQIFDGPSGRQLGIDKSGPGTLTLSGANNYTYITTVSAGTIAIGNNSALGTGPVVLGTTYAPTLSASGGPRSINNDIWLSSVATGKATFSGTNDLVFTGKILNHSGDRTLNVTNTGTTTLSGRIVLSETCSTSRALTFGGTGNLQINANVVDCEGAGSPSRLRFEYFTGTAFINGTNTYSGMTYLIGGRFLLGNKSVFGTSVVYLNDIFISSTADLTGINSISNSTWQSGHPTFTGSNSIEFSGGWTNNGSRTLTNNITNGVLSITNTVNLSSVTTNSTFSFDGAGTTSISGLIMNGASTASNITYSGTGALILANRANSYSGTTTVNSGELRINPATVAASFASRIVLNGGRLSTTNIGSDVTWSSSSTLVVSSNASIDVGSNSHFLKFADSHAATWSGSTLTINGWTGPGGSTGTGGRIFFGSGPGGLTAAQLAKITFTGYNGPAILLSTGELVPTAQCTAPIITMPANGQFANQFITYGDNANFTVVATGTAPLAYNWRVSKDDGTSFSDVGAESFTGYAGANSSSITIAKPGVAMNNYQYECVITNSCGAVTSTAGVLMVNPRSLNISISASDKEYDGSTTAEVVVITPTSNVVSGDDVTARARNGSFNSKSAGISKTVTADIYLEGADASNYVINSTASATARINPKPLIIQITSTSRMYDGTMNANVQVVRPVDGVIVGDDVEAIAGNAFFDSKDVGLSKPVTAEVSVTGLDAGNYTVNSTASAAADIIPLRVNGSFATEDKIYDGTVTANVLSRSVIGVIAGDDVTLTGGTASFFDGNIGTDKAVILTDAVLSGEASRNYSLASVSTTTANISQRPIVIAAAAQRKTYGEIDPEFTVQVQSGTVISGDLPSGTLHRESGESVGEYKVSEGTFSYGSNYAETFLPATFSIVPLEVSVFATAKTKTYGENDPAFTYTCLPAEGTVLPNKEVVSLNGDLSRVEGEAVQSSPYRIQQGSLSNSNYSINFAEADLTIHPAILSVRVDDKSKEFGAPLPELTGSITGVRQFDGITASYNTVATEMSDVVSSGYPITANFNDPNNKLSNYTVFVSPGVLMITKANAAITVTGYAGAYDGTQHGVVSTSAKGLAGEDFNAILHLAPTTYTNVPGGPLHWDFEGNRNYNATSGDATVTITRANARIEVNGYDVAYDATSHVASGVAIGVEGKPADLSGLLSLTGTTHTDAGDYEFDEWSFAGNINYNATKGTVHNRITKGASNATVNVSNAVYDGNPHGATATITAGGRLEQPLIVSYSGTGSTSYGPSNEAPINAGSYTASASFSGDINHEGSMDSKNFTIQKANAVITIVPYNVTYDGLEHMAGFTARGVESSPVDLGYLVDVSHTAHVNAGDYSDDYWSFAGNSDYNPVGNRIVVNKIDKASSTTEVTINGGPFTYTGSEIRPADVVVQGAGGLNVSCTAAYSNNVNAGTATVFYNFAGDDNHTGSSDTKTFTIDKKQLTVTAENKQKVYDGLSYTDGGEIFDATISGFAASETLQTSGLTGSPAFEGPAVTEVHPGSHLIRPAVGTLEALNYSFRFEDGTLKIDKRVVDISGSKIYNGNSIFNGADLIAGNVVGNDVVKVEGTATVSNKQVGNYTAFMTSSLICTNSDYQVKDGAIRINITQRPLTVTARGVDKVYDGNTDAAANLSSDKLTGDDVRLSYTSASFTDPNAGTREVSVAGISIDGTDAGNYELVNSIFVTSATISKASTTSVLTTSAEAVRYMDQLTLTARITPANKRNELTGTVQFKIGSVLFGSPATVVPIPNDSDGAVQATCTGQVTNLPSASYPVEAVFTSTNPNYDNSSDRKVLQVNQRNADPYNVNVGFYTGEVFAWTTGQNSSTGTIMLSTTVTDNNTPKGDLRGARVTFYLVNAGSMTPISGATNLPVGLIDITDGSVGTASAIVQFNIGSNNAQDFRIAVGIAGAYYNASTSAVSQAILTISKAVPGGYMVCGGRIKNVSSAGYIKGDPGSLTGFESDIVYTRSGTNPKGKADVLIRSYYKTDGTLDSKEHTYIITTNAIASLNVAGTLPTATFSSKANLYEQLQDMSLVLIEGGAVFEMIVSQKGCYQQAAITLYRKAGGLWFSSSWNGSKTILQDLSAGQASVAGGGPCNKTISSYIVVKDHPVNAMQEKSLPKKPEVYPNPTTSQFNLKLATDNSSDAIRIVVYTTNGRIIEQRQNLAAGQTLQLGALYRPGVYILEIIQGDARKQLKLVKIPD